MPKSRPGNDRTTTPAQDRKEPPFSELDLTARLNQVIDEGILKRARAKPRPPSEHVGELRWTD